MTGTVLDDLTFSYFPICGRGAPVRYFLEDNGIKYTDEGVGEFRELKMDNSEFLFNQLPRIKLTNGKKVVQTLAILQYLASVLGKAGSGNADEDAIVYQLNYGVEDAISVYQKAVYSDDHANLLKGFATDTVKRFFTAFEFLLKDSKTDYFVYDYPSFPEYQLLYLTKVSLVLNPAALEPYPLLAKWRATMLEREGLKAYIASGREPTPLNGKPTADACIF